ncbi:MAG: 4Fe-4S dicluster domain-containing protein [Desulfarculus sp.]|nr:4Fe-4S dicluster domain-containing protein [Pseudomonadota bacterium]MBV1716631.1 4Fe-4S dicluster domain-containing protein [Desulfarculus sp.]MBU4576238.1 4Fe-4S dicluster domain-containing protein [Pseudomonadota bacterium]MBU4597064.1 4Fe-4S dicluster domain-containing protein [Pseudomonadota bacterium]MBV1739307.1 4Fe-4S dicluster domain-containing protein [Desulfarculus sp.]
MFFDLSLYLALAICVAGLIYKIRSWLTVSVDQQDRRYSPAQRAGAAMAGLGRTVFSRRIGAMLRALVLDGLLQGRSLRHSGLAWVAHIFLFVGFMGLLLLHALGEQITASLFRDYYPTLDPWLWLREALGIMVLVGVGLIILRRFFVRGLRLTTRTRDRLAIILLAVVLLSGFALQATKITSSEAFDRMAVEYAGLDDPREIKALRSVWATDYGVVFAPGQTGVGAELMALGRELNANSCVECHSPAAHAFASYGLSVILRPVALALDRAGGPQALYFIHFLACFLGLAILPFTKFLHLIVGPVILAVNAATERATMNPAARAALRALELDACTHCGTCTVHCSVAVTLRLLPNDEILPSERLASLAAKVHGNNGDRAHLAAMRDGAYICTNCQRCTRLCPLGINLNDLWTALKQDLADEGLGAPLKEISTFAGQAALPSRGRKEVLVNTNGFQKELKHSAQANSFAECYSCRECTNACPQVFMSEWPNQELDLLPHQIMYCLKLGLKEEAMGARMVWSCLTCYECQEACPNLVQVTDVMYELRYLAAQAARTATA